ncbi:carboxypeptidase-like regulatory domain-containing protein [Daejeonella rubra]|nr:carboxypeptidase-like regulatory domain-containing protein [Daejeonella rubra]
MSLLLLFIGSNTVNLIASSKKANLADSITFTQYKGKVADSRNKKELSFATLSLMGTNISTVTNSEGEFSIKVPNNKLAGQLMLSYIGYKNKVVSLKELKPDNNLITLDPYNIALGEVIVSTNDAELLFKQVLQKREQNYSKDQNLMTGFYRETIKKRKTYLSLSESVVEIEKQPYISNTDDFIQLFKGRKNTDYTKLDTLTFKLQGGPYTTIFLDIMKYPDIIFTDDPLANYTFSLENNTQIDDRKVYVLSFKQRPQIIDPLYYGKLYIDTESLAVISATFNLNVENRKAVSNMVTQKKPIGAEVYPTVASYQINYRESNGKWLFGYSRGDIIFRVNWDKKLFNSTYESTIELAVTDWKKGFNDAKKTTEKLRQNVIMIDKVSNFADPEFWGEYNIIEPEKSIETAIKKIQRKM